MEDQLALDSMPDAQPWTKAIPPARNRLQSRILVWLLVPTLCYAAFFCFQMLLAREDPAFLRSIIHSWLIHEIPVSALFGLAAWRLRAATAPAAACGALICFQITVATYWGLDSSIFHTGLTPLLLLFILTFEATRLSQRRRRADDSTESHGPRNTAQVVANLGVAALLVLGWGRELLFIVGHVPGDIQGDSDRAIRYYAILYLPMLAALAEAAADTVSSEIGQAFGGQPFLLTTLRRVPPGTDGAVSLNGTLAGIAAAAIVAASGAPALGMSLSECLVAFAAAILGLFFDSLLGATLERRGWIGNDLVNFASTAFAASTSLAAVRFFGDSLAGFR
jgi:uncharacterized membrane protein